MNTSKRADSETIFFVSESNQTLLNGSSWWKINLFKLVITPEKQLMPLC